MDDEIQRTLEQRGLQFFADHSDRITKLCRWLCRRAPISMRAQLLEDALDEALRVIPMALNTYKENGASLLTHVLVRIRWDVWMLVKSCSTEKESADGPEPYIYDSHLEFQTLDEVYYILERIPAAYAQLLRWRYIDELSFEQIGVLLECAASGAHRYVNDAIEAARGVAKVRD